MKNKKIILLIAFIMSSVFFADNIYADDACSYCDPAYDCEVCGCMLSTSGSDDADDWTCVDKQNIRSFSCGYVRGDIALFDNLSEEDTTYISFSGVDSSGINLDTIKKYSYKEFKPDEYKYAHYEWENTRLNGELLGDIRLFFQFNEQTNEYETFSIDFRFGNGEFYKTENINFKPNSFNKCPSEIYVFENSDGEQIYTTDSNFEIEKSKCSYANFDLLQYKVSINYNGSKLEQKAINAYLPGTNQFLRTEEKDAYYFDNDFYDELDLEKKCPEMMYLNVGLGEITDEFTTTKETRYACGENEGKITGIPLKIPKLTSYAFTIIQVAVPIILILMGSIDLFKGITAQKEDEIKKEQHILIKRIIVAVLIFLVIIIVKFIISLVAGATSSNIVDCIDCFVNESCGYSGDIMDVALKK